MEVVVVAMVKVATAEMVMVAVERVTPSRGAFDNNIILIFSLKLKGPTLRKEVKTTHVVGWDLL